MGPQAAHLLLGVDEAGGDSGSVDAPAGVLVDLDIGLTVPGVRVPCAVKQVQDLLIVELGEGPMSVHRIPFSHLGPKCLQHQGDS